MESGAKSCEVKKAMKSRGGLGREVPLSPVLLPRFYFFALLFTSHRSPQLLISGLAATLPPLPRNDSHKNVAGGTRPLALGRNLQNLVSLRVFGMEIYYICTFRYCLVLCIKKFTTSALTLTTQKSSLEVSLIWSLTHIGSP